jgi:hypothetical protein
VVISRQGIFTEYGLQRAVRERWEVQGRLQAVDPAALTAAIGALETAYSVQGQTIGFYLDDGTPTGHGIDPLQTNGGVRVVVPPSFPHGKGAEYSTFRNYALSVEAEILDSSSSILSWSEALNFNGGGPQFGFLEPINGIPQKQLLKQATTFKVAQSGEAVGNGGYPFPPAPIWPDAEHLDQRRLVYDLPKRMGPPGAASYTQYRITWSYEFEAESPLAGLPTPWPV